MSNIQHATCKPSVPISTHLLRGKLPGSGPADPCPPSSPFPSSPLPPFPRISLLLFRSVSCALQQLPAHLLLSFVPLLPSHLLTQAVLLRQHFQNPVSPPLYENCKVKVLCMEVNRLSAGPAPGVALDALPHPRRVRHVLVTAACQH